MNTFLIKSGELVEQWHCLLDVIFVRMTVMYRHGFGDCRKPLPESAALIEDIVYRQMVDIVSNVFSLHEMQL